MPHPKRTDLDAIVAAALKVLDERGLDRLSMHAIADRLGVAQPALYHHVTDKDALLAEMAANVLHRRHTDRLPAQDESWQEFVARNAHSLRRAMLSVRDGARLIASAGPRSPDLDNAIAQTGLLERGGLAGPNAVLALIAIARYTIGATLEEQTARDGSVIIIPTDLTDDAVVHFVELAAEVNTLGPEHEFDVGLTALISGLGHLGNDDQLSATRSVPAR